MKKVAIVALSLMAVTGHANAKSRHHHHHQAVHHNRHRDATAPVAAAITNDLFGAGAASGTGAIMVSDTPPSMPAYTRHGTVTAIREPVHSGGVVGVHLIDGQVIHVAAAFASRFQGFFNALYHREGHLPRITCAASGHMKHSLHHWGGACDAGQSARNVAPRMMYHVASLASEYGLRDGCSFHTNGPDCGHIDAGLGGGHRHYASRHHHRHYASR